MRKIKYKIIYNNMLCIVLLIIILKVLNCYSVSVNIKNNTDAIESIYFIKNTLDRYANETEIQLNLLDSYYDLDRYWDRLSTDILYFRISNHQTVTFMGLNEKSEFDLGVTKMKIEIRETNDTIKSGTVNFKNIKFKGNEIVEYEKTGAVEIDIDNYENFAVNIDNCIFESNIYINYK